MTEKKPEEEKPKATKPEEKKPEEKGNRTSDYSWCPYWLNDNDRWD